MPFRLPHEVLRRSYEQDPSKWQISNYDPSDWNVPSFTEHPITQAMGVRHSKPLGCYTDKVVLHANDDPLVLVTFCFVIVVCDFCFGSFWCSKGPPETEPAQHALYWFRLIPPTTQHMSISSVSFLVYFLVLCFDGCVWNNTCRTAFIGCPLVSRGCGNDAQSFPACVACCVSAVATGIAHWTRRRLSSITR